MKCADLKAQEYPAEQIAEITGLGLDDADGLHAAI